jgi:hypothetical protein
MKIGPEHEPIEVPDPVPSQEPVPEPEPVEPKREEVPA